MKKEEIIKKVLDKNLIPPENIEKYLLDNQWKRIYHSENKRISIYEIYKNDKKHHIVLPFYKGFKNYTESIKKAIKVISEIEKKDIYKVIFLF